MLGDLRVAGVALRTLVCALTLYSFTSQAALGPVILRLSLDIHPGIPDRRKHLAVLNSRLVLSGVVVAALITSCAGERTINRDQSSLETPGSGRDAEEGRMPYIPGARKKDSEIGEVLAHNQDRLLAIEGVTGVGIGQGPTGDPALILYLLDESARERVPEAIEGFPVITVVTGPIEIQPPSK